MLGGYGLEIWGYWRWYPCIDGAIFTKSQKGDLALYMTRPWRRRCERRVYCSLNIGRRCRNFPPLFTSWSKVKQFAPNLVKDTWLLRTSAVTSASPGPIHLRHRVEVRKATIPPRAWIFSPEIDTNLIIAEEAFHALAHSTSANIRENFSSSIVCPPPHRPGTPPHSQAPQRLRLGRGINYQVPFSGRFFGQRSEVADTGMGLR